MESRHPITLGRIDYANAWPIFFHLHEARLGGGVQVTTQVPARLNAGLQRGELDVAAISSFAYAQHSDDYILLPGLSVSSEDRVNSILLFMKRPLEEVLQGTIAMTNTSATSVNLLRILMHNYYGAQPHYTTTAPSLDDMLESADAALLIGDTAIKASWRDTGCQIIDLGALWRRWTGHGMTYAVVAARKDVAQQQPELLSELHEALLDSKRRSLQQPELLVARACEELGGEPAYWRRYFQELNYDLGPSQQAGLSLYFRYARELGLLEQDVRMQYLNHQSLSHG
ncbi:menaquinone biosynthesis protein [Paenibacillus sp. 1P07SE]|uniref:menaquinone biosynthesis protein n=1 Tax=Paenibacillus sp. 1P07SE TaxID=3132209 RepID=UPI0039A40742